MDESLTRALALLALSIAELRSERDQARAQTAQLAQRVRELEDRVVEKLDPEPLP